MGFVDRDYFKLAVALYGLSAIYSLLVWRRGFREDNRTNYALLLTAFLFHTVAMFKRGFSLERCPVNNLYEATTFVEWTIAAACMAASAWPRLRFLGAFAAPFLLGIGVFALVPALDVHGPKPQFVHGWVSLHAALILLAYGAFGLGSVAALMYLTQERDLKLRKMRAFFSRLPSIQRLEKVMSMLLVAGFGLLTAGLMMSPWLMKQKLGVYFQADPKIIWSLLVWCLYLGLLAMRWPLALGGRRLAWGVVASFSFVLLTFWGFNLLSAVHHP